MPREWTDPPRNDDRFDGRDGYHYWNTRVCHQYYRRGYCKRGAGCKKEHLIRPVYDGPYDRPLPTTPAMWADGGATSSASTSTQVAGATPSLSRSTEQAQASTTVKPSRDAQTQTTELPDAYKCVICMEHAREYAFYPCGHFGYCGNCLCRSANGARLPSTCFTCRTPCTALIRLYMI